MSMDWLLAAKFVLLLKKVLKMGQNSAALEASTKLYKSLLNEVKN